MLITLSINNFRSLLNLTVALGPLNIVTGPNGSGKSNLYRSLRLLAQTARGGVINSLAAEGGLTSTFWAGPEKISTRMKSGSVPVEGGPRQNTVRLRLGFSTEEFGYAIVLGLPAPSASAFALDPEIKQECIWAGEFYRPASTLIDRKGPTVRIRDGRQWRVIEQHFPAYTSMFDHGADPLAAPELFQLRESIAGWRFYDHFRTDADAPARQAQLGTRTPVLHHDGRDVAAALQTIREIGDGQALDETIEDAFPGASLTIEQQHDGRFSLSFNQHGLLRALSGKELSDGTLRFILWVAALLTPRPPPLMVLNEPETSLHPDLVPALARLILRAASTTQIWVISHSSQLIEQLNAESTDCNLIKLEKVLGQTELPGVDPLEEPPWYWPDKK